MRRRPLSSPRPLAESRGAALLHAVSCAPDRNAISFAEGAACIAGAREGSGLQHIIDEITFYGQRRVTKLRRKKETF